jgi:hypothetical protein
MDDGVWKDKEADLSSKNGSFLLEIHFFGSATWATELEGGEFLGHI